MDYNKTINLPKTDFPMRAGLPNRETDMLQRWNDMDLYNELLKKNEGKPLFSLHDGPPSGTIWTCTTSCSRRTRASPWSPSTTALPSPTADCTWATP